MSMSHFHDQKSGLEKNVVSSELKKSWGTTLSCFNFYANSKNDHEDLIFLLGTVHTGLGTRNWVLIF